MNFLYGLIGRANLQNSIGRVDFRRTHCAVKLLPNLPELPIDGSRRGKFAEVSVNADFVGIRLVGFPALDREAVAVDAWCQLQLAIQRNARHGHHREFDVKIFHLQTDGRSKQPACADVKHFKIGI